MPKAIGEWKVCSRCGEKKNVNEFHKNHARPDKLEYACAKCKNACGRAWKARNKEQISEYNEKYRFEHYGENKNYWYNYYRSSGYKERKRNIKDKIKEQFIEMYGGKCSCCGEHRKEFLTIEHINGQAGMKIKEGGIRGYRKAVAKYQPDVYDLLCMNCNFSKGKFGYCPHDNERQTEVLK